MASSVAPQGACLPFPGQCGRATQMPASDRSGRGLFSKTTLCRYFSRSGACDRGAECRFAHGGSELRAKPNLRKTAICRLWVEGRCPNSSRDCSWAHGARELQRSGAEEAASETGCLSETSGTERNQRFGLEAPQSQSPRSRGLKSSQPESTFDNVHSRKDDRDVGHGALVLVSLLCANPSNNVFASSDWIDAQPSLQKRCPRCQSEFYLPATDNFCVRCGSELQESRARATMDDDRSASPQHRAAQRRRRLCRSARAGSDGYTTPPPSGHEKGRFSDEFRSGEQQSPTTCPSDEYSSEECHSATGCHSDEDQGPTGTSSTSCCETSSRSSDGYHSDDECFFERRDAYRRSAPSGRL